MPPRYPLFKGFTVYTWRHIIIIAITGSERTCSLQAAEEGAERTVTMRAKAGRASYVNVSRLVNPDPGAQAVALWMEAIYTALKN